MSENISEGETTAVTQQREVGEETESATVVRMAERLQVNHEARRQDR